MARPFRFAYKNMTIKCDDIYSFITADDSTDPPLIDECDVNFAQKILAFAMERETDPGKQREYHELDSDIEVKLACADNVRNNATVYSSDDDKESTTLIPVSTNRPKASFDDAFQNVLGFVRMAMNGQLDSSAVKQDTLVNIATTMSIAFKQLGVEDIQVKLRPDKEGTPKGDDASESDGI